MSTPGADEGRDPADAGRAALYAPFRPRYARIVTLAFAGVVAVLTVVLIVTFPQLAPDSEVLGDQIGFGLVGAGITLFCWRQATVAARVSPEGIAVRNLVFSRRLGWAEVVLVRYGEGRPWAQLDRADGTTLAVMGVQRADGARAEREARRLATLVELHTRTERDD
ncbi:PH domain-containing protein [Cellulomonas timonensis]|uniref:PH domain-containing protein n=1 Tax=Cellulomonas timonensis TaxID=1689271 RepID=UPI0009ECCA99|nr:PH domain-containing protein [Cellulomonas timonensis]